MELERQSFLNYIKYEKQYSFHTVNAYQSDLDDFFLFTSNMNIGSLDEVATAIVRSWMVELVERGFTNRSIHRKMATLRSFFKFLYHKGSITNKVMDGIVLPKVRKRLPEYAEIAVIDKLLDPLAYGKNYTDKRDFFIIHLLYYTGIRRSELIQLDSNSFDSTRGVLKVWGKGGKERLIPIGGETWKMYQNYVEIRRKEFPHLSLEEAFWLTGKGTRIYPKLVYSIVTKHFKRAGHFGKGSPHVLRHTFATHLSNEGAELNAIKDLLGHSGLAATQIYTHNSIKRLQEVYEKAHPKAE
ncbi:MAG: hypothetical protein RLZZ248_1790 [Bacteroidota bacterium]